MELVRKMTLAEKIRRECQNNISCDPHDCSYRDICLRLDWRVAPDEWCDKMVAQYDGLFREIAKEMKE